jgi:hypothetical protein
MKLGEILIQLGLATPEQVQTALRAQEQVGGKLGTQLVEAKVIGTDQLALALARQMGVPPALEHHFAQADPAVLNRMKPALAARYMAIPLAIPRTGPKRVVVAMTTPLDVTAVDELSFALDAPVEPVVASELVIARNIKRLYGIEVALKPRTTPQPATNEATGGLPALKSVKEPPAKAPHAVAQRVPSPRPTSPPPPPCRLDLDEALRHMGAVEHRDQVPDILIDYMTGRFGCGLVFLIREGTARAWRGLAPGIQQAAIATIAFPIAMPSSFQIAFERGAPFRGLPPPEGMSLERKVWKYLRCAAPKEVVVLPICVAGRVVVLVYAHAIRGEPLPDGPVGELHALCAAASAALVRLIQKLRNDSEAVSHAP